MHQATEGWSAWSGPVGRTGGSPEASGDQPNEPAPPRTLIY